jgi:hypothetical protein
VCWLPASAVHDAGDRGAVWSAEQRKHLACFEFARVS